METINYNSVILYIPKRYAIDNLLQRFKTNSYEKEEVELLSFFNESHTILELGACLGYLSILLSRKVKEIYSVEANPELMESLEKTKESNKSKNLFLYNCIVDKEISSKQFYTYDLIVAGSSDRSDYNNNGWQNSMKKYTIPCKSIDTFSNTINSLVIDIEGGELDFFQQNKEYIKKNIELILVELHGRFMSDKNFNEKCIYLLKESGFLIIKIIGSTYLFKKVSE